MKISVPKVKLSPLCTIPQIFIHNQHGHKMLVPVGPGSTVFRSMTNAMSERDHKVVFHRAESPVSGQYKDRQDDSG